MEEVNKIDPEVELKPAKQKFKGCEAFDMYFTGMGGARIHAKYMRPENVKNAPVIYMFHGYGGNAGSWYALLGAVSQGYCVAALDCRGQNGESEDNNSGNRHTAMGQLVRGLESDSPKDLLFVNIFLDVVKLVDIVEKFEETDENNMFAKGGSQGGALTFVCAALCPQIKAAVAAMPYLSDYKGVWQINNCSGPYAGINCFFRVEDPTHEREDEIFTRLGYIDIQNMAPRIKCRMLMMTGLLDNICPPLTQFAAYNKITSEKKVMIYPEYGHEELPEHMEIALDWFSK